MTTKNESADNRTMATDAVATIGMLIPEHAGRDAIHLAVEPVVAGERLAPGQHIGFLPDGTVGQKSAELLGIVDPFLAGTLFPGDRFWLVVYPRTITSLRHVWAHPSFKPAEIEAPEKPSNKDYSKEWMQRWANEHMSSDYYGDYDGGYDDNKVPDEVAYANAIRAGHTHSVGSHEDARDHINDEWWGHWEVITGEKGDREEYFSCSC